MMHNLGIVRSETAKTGEEIAYVSHLNLEETLKYLKKHEEEGYIRRRVTGLETAFYLTASGILNVCGTLT